MAFGTLVNMVLQICLILFFFPSSSSFFFFIICTVGIVSFIVSGYNVGDCISDVQELSSLHVLF